MHLCLQEKMQMAAQSVFFVYCWKNLFVVIYGALVVMKWSDGSYCVFSFT